MTLSFLGFSAADRQSTLQAANAVNLRLLVDDKLRRVDLDCSGAGAGAGAELGAGAGAGAGLPRSPKDGIR